MIDRKVNGAGAVSGVRLDISPPQTVTVECPTCGTAFPLSESVIHDIELGALHRQAGHNEERIIHARREGAEQARQEAIAELAVVITALRQEIAELKKEKKALHAREIESQNAQRKLETEREAEKLANAKWRRVAAAEIRAEENQRATDRAAEEYRLTDIKHEKTIKDLKEQNAAMKRKLDQSSQQLQGDVGELDLERGLRDASPSDDDITPVKKGAYGADVIQTVHTRLGTDAGKALYESKTAKEWSDTWATKLQTDMSTTGAHFGVIVSRALPRGVSYLGRIPCCPTLWVAEPQAIPVISIVVRAMILHAHTVAAQSANQYDHDRAVGEYIRSPEFQNKAQLVEPAVQEMVRRITLMRNYTTTGLNALEQAVSRLSAAVFGIIGDFQGLTGTDIVQMPLAGYETEDASD